MYAAFCYLTADDYPGSKLFFDTHYVGEKFPGNATGLADGANCQHFCYELLRYFGFEIGELRSSDLWADDIFTSVVSDLQPFDLVLFSKDSNPYGAHVGICVGENKVLHLSEKEGKPTIWEITQFQKLPEYSTLIGIKRPKRKIDQHL